MMRIELGDGSQMARRVIRAFCNPKKITLMTGDGFEDHDLWEIEDHRASLLGPSPKLRINVWWEQKSKNPLRWTRRISVGSTAEPRWE